MFFHILFRVHTHIYLCTSVFFFFFSFPSFFNFVVCKLCRLFPFYVHFFLEYHTILKRIFPISSNFLCSHSAKSHQEKSLLCTEVFCFSTLDLFAMTFHIIFFLLPPGCSNHSHRPGANPHLHWYTHLLE
jgi:hypothetical protein